MAGNSSRRGAVKKTGKGNPTAGSGGRRRRGLQGKGPTPKAKDREGHVARKRRQSAAKTAGGPRRGPRPGEDSTWVAGRNAVVEALRAGLPVSAVYVAEGMTRDGRCREAFALSAERGVSLLEVSRAELDRLTGGAVHQGLAAKAPPYDYAHPDDLLAVARERGETALVVALDSVTDPHNLGAVVRSAAGFGAHGVLVPERRSASMTAAAWKSSAGAAARVPVARATNLTRALKGYQGAGCQVVGLAADGEVTLDELAAEPSRGPLVVVVGSEGDGLSRLVRETCDVRVRIPMAGDLESLNASVAASVTLYALTRRPAEE
ncbi:MAG TPA: 23S rRNA (guanosine(2251)-2'-O)-methyltransferase RlmB [Nocardioidaceae bacterium]|nr:23S rRNA (guanosine(2251)-2'-O)-methyltransferase RlmB [Nocardioidaceae bacterium]